MVKNDVRAESNMLKILPIIPSRTSKFLTHYSQLHYYLLFLLILVIFIVSVITMSTIHIVTIEQDIASADFSSDSSCMK